MRIRTYFLRFAGALAALVIAATPAAAFATEGDSGGSGTESGTETHTSTGDQTETEGTTTGGDSTEHSDGAKHKLEANKLRVCKLHQEKVNSVMSFADRRVNTHLEVFNKIFERVQAFHTKSGKTVANYDTLVAAVISAKTATESDIATLKTLSAFKCDGNDPKGDVAAYKAQLSKIKQDFQNYRSALKDLIKAVKTAQGDSQGDSNESH